MKEGKESCGIVLWISHADTCSVTIVQTLDVVFNLFLHTIFDESINDTEVQHRVTKQNTTFELLMEWK
ncbi:hypothetical protein D3C80_1582510 [compost metagenome]